MIDPIDSISLEWRLQAIMVDRGFKFATNLRDALQADGVNISTTAISRMVYKQPKEMDLALLQSLCRVLQCTPNDLLVRAGK